MTKEELERYLEVESILKMHDIAIDKNGLMSCPFHPNCEGSLKLYRELNGVACMRESCSNYRKVFAAFEVLQELKGCSANEAKLYGKSLLLEELERLRGARKEEKQESAQKLHKKDKGLVAFWIKLKGLILELGGGNKDYEFSLREIREEMNIAKTSQHRFVQQLVEMDYLCKISGYSNKGYYYQVTNWN
jgi:hypothetical protein